MDKYQSALIEYAKTKRALEECAKGIAAELDLSRLKAEQTWPKDYYKYPIAPPEWERLGGKNLWLHLAYEREHSGHEDGFYYVNHEEDVVGFLEEKCQHALAAHKLIGKRKALRYDHGIAKRRLTMLANNLLANIENSEG